MNKGNKVFIDKVDSIETDLKETNSINKDLKDELKTNNKEMLMLVGGSQNLSNMLVHQRSPICKFGLGGDHY